jgi:hypothetical protein
VSLLRAWGLSDPWRSERLTKTRGRADEATTWIVAILLIKNRRPVAITHIEAGFHYVDETGRFWLPRS